MYILIRVTVDGSRTPGEAPPPLSAPWNGCLESMASPPTKSLGFRGFDSSRLLILKGGNSHVRRVL